MARWETCRVGSRRRIGSRPISDEGSYETREMLDNTDGKTHEATHGLNGSGNKDAKVGDMRQQMVKVIHSGLACGRYDSRTRSEAERC